MKKNFFPRVRLAQTGFTQSPGEVVMSGSDRPGISAPADSVEAAAVADSAAVAAVEALAAAEAEAPDRSARPEHCRHPRTVCAAAAGSGGRTERSCRPGTL